MNFVTYALEKEGELAPHRTGVIERPIAGAACNAAQVDDFELVRLDGNIHLSVFVVDVQIKEAFDFAKVFDDLFEILLFLVSIFIFLGRRRRFLASAVSSRNGGAISSQHGRKRKGAQNKS